MNQLNIDLGGGTDYLAPLYTLPEGSTAEQVIAEVKYWFGQTLDRDGYKDIQFTVEVEASSGSITLSSPEPLPPRTMQYVEMQQYLKIGRDAWDNVAKAIIEEKDGKWHFFMPHGLPMLNFETIQFFHYPPLRLFENRDYLDDPVPYRWAELLEAAGVPNGQTIPYQRYIDAVPIAADDDQGIYMPATLFADYQIAMVKFFLHLSNPNSVNTTCPVIVFGIPAMAQFEHLFGTNLDILVPQTAHIVGVLPDLPKQTTACLGATHPYHFYAQAQIDGKGTIGRGELGRGCQLAKMLMQQDLIAAIWQVGMARDPGQSPGDMLVTATAQALAPDRQAEICALTVHQGSLLYPEPPPSLKFCFKTDLKTAKAQCSTNDDPCVSVGE